MIPNPFQTGKPLPAEKMIDRERESDELFSLIQGGHAFRLAGPRRYGKTTLLKHVLQRVEREGKITVLVDLKDVMSISELVVRIERAYAKRLKGGLLNKLENILRARNVGLSFSGPGFTASLQKNPSVDPTATLLELLNLPDKVFESQGIQSVIIFDEIQDLLKVKSAPGIVRSVIQHQEESATYGFAGSAPGLVREMFENPDSAFMDQAIPKSLPPLPINDIADRVGQEFSASEKEVNAAALSSFLHFTRGHPQRSMLLAHYLWDAVPNDSPGIEEHWFQALTRALKENRHKLYSEWHSLPDNQRRALKGLAINGKPNSKLSLKATGLSEGSVGKTLQALEDIGAVIDTDSGYKITDPLMEEWLRQQGLLPQEGEDDTTLIT